MKAAQKQSKESRIRQHGLTLLATFPHATDTLLGNHEPYDSLHEPIVPVFINRDPRGYALKIRDEWMTAHPECKITRDWGGYGIIAPEIK